MKVLLDTTVLVDHLRNFGPATTFLKETRTLSQMAVSVITVAEVLSGKDCADPSVRSQVEGFIEALERIDVDMEVAAKAADFRRRYGTPLADALIAATAQIEGMSLYTKNAKDFGKIREIKTIVPY